MANTKSSEFPLTWKPYGKRRGKPVAGGQWVKKFNGKQKSFGSSPRRGDRDAKEAALAKYLVHQKQDDLYHFAQQFFREQEAKFSKLPPDPRDDPRVQKQLEREHEERLLDLLPNDDKDPALVRFEEHQALEDLKRLVDRQKQRKVVDSQSPSDPAQLATVAEAVDRYVKARERDCQLTEKTQGDLPQRRRLTIATLNSIKTQTKYFGQFAANTSCNVRAIEKLLDDFADHLQEKIISGEYTAWTVNTKLSKVRSFINWCAAQGHIEGIPRNLKAACARYGTEKGGKSFSLVDIQKLWSAADDRQKCWIALGLNCGYYPIDIGELKGEHLIDGRIIRKRKKTGALQNYKLWPVTLELIQRTRMDIGANAGGRLWLSSHGNPVAKDNNKTVTLHFSRLAKAAKVKGTFAQLRDTSAQQVEHYSRQKDRVDPALVSLFLSHRDQRTAAYYISDKPEDMNTKSLDDATDHLEGVYKLKLGDC